MLRQGSERNLLNMKRITFALCVVLSSLLGCAPNRDHVPFSEYRVSRHDLETARLRDFVPVAGHYGNLFPLSGTHDQVLWRVSVPTEAFDHIALNVIPTGLSDGYVVFQVLRDESGEPTDAVIYEHVFHLIADQHLPHYNPLIIPVPAIPDKYIWLRVMTTQTAHYEMILNFAFAKDYVGKCYLSHDYSVCDECPGYLFLRSKGTSSGNSRDTHQ